MPRKIANPNQLLYYVLAKLKSASHLKLQKVMYYVQGWHLAYFDEPLFDEDFQAWMHGPVLRSVYDTLKDKSILHGDLRLRPEHIPGAISRFEGSLLPEQVELVRHVLDEYGDKTSYHLENLTHSEPPWRLARQGLEPSERSTRVVQKEQMKSYFQSLMTQDVEETV